MSSNVQELKNLHKLCIIHKKLTNVKHEHSVYITYEKLDSLDQLETLVLDVVFPSQARFEKVNEHR